MNWSKRDFVATMEAGKARAQTARNRGMSTGKAAKGWVRVGWRRGTRRPEDGGPTGQEIANSYGILAVELAIEDFMRDLYPQRYEAFQ